MDDGLANHLLGSNIPPTLTLTSTQGKPIRIAELPGLTIIFCYPRTGAPEEPVKEEWNNTPGARGCTAEASGYRDGYPALTALGVDAVFGLSTQGTAFQKEAKERLHLPFDILSDENLQFIKTMKMPTFEWEGQVLTKRITLAVKDGKIEHVWYPVFPPAENATEVAEFLKTAKLA
jgi:peroxiredoxin